MFYVLSHKGLGTSGVYFVQAGQDQRTVQPQASDIPSTFSHSSSSCPLTWTQNYGGHPAFRGLLNLLRHNSHYFCLVWEGRFPSYEGIILLTMTPVQSPLWLVKWCSDLLPRRWRLNHFQFFNRVLWGDPNTLKRQVAVPGSAKVFRACLWV